MTPEAYRRAIEINEEIKKNKEELYIIRSGFSSAKLSISRFWTASGEMQLSKKDIELLKEERGKRIEELEQELRELV